MLRESAIFSQTCYDVTRGTANSANKYKLRICHILQTILAHYDCETMAKRCVAGGCDEGNEAWLSLHKFSKNAVTRDQWSREVAKTRSD